MARLLHPHFQLFLTVVLITVSEIALKRGAEATAPTGADWLGLASLAAPNVWLGAALLVVSSITWILTLRGMPLYLAFTLCSVIHITIPVSAWWFLDEKINAQRWLGIALVLAGIWVIARPASRIEEKT